MKRRAFNRSVLGALAATPWLSACGGGGSNSSSATPVMDPVALLAADTASEHFATVTLGERTSASPEVNRLVLGSNIQWVDRGETLLDANGAYVLDDTGPLNLARELLPTAMRYPGGLQADAFRWSEAQNLHVFNGVMQDTLFDTTRFLELCEATGAQPVITANVCFGDTAAEAAAEAAAWLRQTNITRLTSPLFGTLKKVQFWEIGNEPYLYADEYPAAYLTPEEFADRAAAIIAALRAVAAEPDSDGVVTPIYIGLPLTAEMRNGVPIPAQPGEHAGVDSTRFTQRVLTRLAATRTEFDFVALHNAYLPLQPLSSKESFDAYQTYASAMAASATVEADIAAVKTLVQTHYTGTNKSALRFAVTEYAPLFVSNYDNESATGESLNASADAWSAGPAGALYMADLALTLAARSDIWFANHWSLIGNGLFGAVGLDASNNDAPYARPMHAVLKMLATAMPSGALALPYDLVCRSTSIDSYGLVAAASVKRIRTLLTYTAATSATSTQAAAPAALRLLLINKDPVRTASVTLALGAWVVSSGASMSSLSLPPDSSPANGPPSDRASDLISTTSTPSVSGPGLIVGLPPHSLSMLTLPLA